MAFESVTVIPYDGMIWDGPAVHPELWRLLQQKNLLIEITSGAGPDPVVLGVPHHAPLDVDRIAEDWINPKTGQAGRPADATTGLAGLAVFTALQEREISCKLVIAVHATDHDPNKTPGCPYWQRVFDGTGPRLLLELHGAAKNRHHGVELSGGRNWLAQPLIFGKALAYYWQSDQPWAVQERPGVKEAWIFKKGRVATAGTLQNPALETASIEYAAQIGRPALHLEMKADFRQPDPDFPTAPRPTPLAWGLARGLADTIDLITRPDDIRISGADLGLPTGAFLTRPALQYEASYLNGVREAGSAEVAGNPDLSITSPDALRRFVEEARKVIFDGLPEDPPEEYLWLIDQGEFIGRVFFLHWLNEYRLKTDGQIDYWIRPSRRGQGYGKLILRLLLERYRQLGLKRVLISCRSDNLPSKSIIEANRGIFESEIQALDSSGVSAPRLRYWINLP